MDKSNFLAFIFRTKYINRWSLMKNTFQENLQEHSWQTAVVAYTLGCLHNKLNPTFVDANVCAVKALFHDVSEIITSDLPTPIKYYNKEVTAAFKALEEEAAKSIVGMLPADCEENFTGLLGSSDSISEEDKIVKYADKICAYIKCLEELKAGNREFAKAAVALEEGLEELQSHVVHVFMEEFIEAFKLTLDEM